MELQSGMGLDVGDVGTNVPVDREDECLHDSVGKQRQRGLGRDLIGTFQKPYPVADVKSCKIDLIG